VFGYMLRKVALPCRGRMSDGGSSSCSFIFLYLEVSAPGEASIFYLRTQPPDSRTLRPIFDVRAGVKTKKENWGNDVSF
jgi:hypothetical protein